jgi:cytochrome c oxidase subunit 2
LFKWGPLVLHTPASAHGAEVDNLMNITWVLILLFKLLLRFYYIILLLNIEVRRSKALYFADNKLEAI